MENAVAVPEVDLSKLGRLQQALVLGALAVVYFLAGKLGLHFAFVHASASAVWPPTGIALAAVLLFGRRIWPAIFVGAFCVNLTTSGSIVSSLGIAVGNTLEATVGASLVAHYAGGVRAFERLAGLLAIHPARRPALHRGQCDDRRNFAGPRWRGRVDGIRRDLADVVVRRCGRGADRHAGAGALGRARQFRNITRPGLSRRCCC